jgi:hypothetical protein
MQTETPPGSYLATHYRDSSRNEETRYVYFDDGRVEALIRGEWRLLCTFTEEQVRGVRDIMRSSGLMSVPDLSGEGFHDTAVYSYAWDLDGERGSVTNRAYPARSHPAFDKLEAYLQAETAEAMGRKDRTQGR